MEAAYLIEGNVFPDDLASMSVLNLPFHMKVPRIFSIKVGEDTVRGNHAHKECWQVILTINHPVRIIAKFGHIQSEYEVTPFNSALIVPPMNWLKLECPKNSMVMVLASEIFSESDYLRDFEEYVRFFESKSNTSERGKI